MQEHSLDAHIKVVERRRAGTKTDGPTGGNQQSGPSHKQLRDIVRKYGKRVRQETSRLQLTCSQLMAADQSRGHGQKQAE